MKRLLALLILSIFGISIVSHVQAKAKETPKLRIGVIQSLTGIASEDGQTGLRGYQLAKDRINSEGRVSIELIVEDDQSDPRQSVSAFKKLASQKVIAILGATWSFTTNSILPLARQNKLVVLNTTTLPESLHLEQGGGYGYGSGISVEGLAEAFKHYLTKNRPKDAVVVHVNNHWGEIQAKKFSEVAVKQGVQIKDTISSAVFDGNEWTAIMPRIRESHAALVLLLINRNDLALFIRKAREQHLDALFYASYHMWNTFHESEEKEALNGICFSYSGPTSAEANEFVQEHERRFQEAPKIYGDNSYDAPGLLAAAYELALKNGTELTHALKRVKFRGLAGDYRFDPRNSFSIGRAVLYCVREGKLQAE